jgi:hypothetical protein
MPTSRLIMTNSQRQWGSDMYMLTFTYYSGSTLGHWAESEAEMLDVIRIHMSSMYAKSVEVVKNF